MEKIALTVEEAAKILSISRSLAYDAVRQGIIPSLRIGRRYIVSRHVIEKMLNGDGQIHTEGDKLCRTTIDVQTANRQR